MLRLPSFRYRAPKTVAEAVSWLAEDPSTTMIVAGGTDLLPNMKRRQQTPKTVIGLRGIGELSGVTHGGAITIGAGTTLTAITRDPRLQAAVPGLWQAASQVATPHLRNMATLGGHVQVEDYANISAGSGVHQFCRVGRYAFIGGYSVVTKDALDELKLKRGDDAVAIIKSTEVMIAREAEAPARGRGRS